jgi:hypothetical protein
MKLPHADLAGVDPAKIGRYLLSETHPVGKSKAGFFREAGFDDSTSDVLIQGLLQIARTQEVLEAAETVHGRSTSSRANWKPPQADASESGRSGSLIKGRTGRAL